ncbi:MAG: ATP-dependent DNA helicase RecG [Phycisphaeraceae bacterium]
MAGPATSAPLDLGTPIGELPGVAHLRACRLQSLGIHTVSDLIRHLPMRYEHESAETTIARLPAHGIGSARGTVLAVRWVPAVGRKVRARFEATLQDDTGTLNITWFNAHYLRGKLHPGMVIRVQGKIKPYQRRSQMVNPQWELLDAPEQVAARQERLRPIYPATEDLPTAAIERLIRRVLPQVLPQINDPLPTELVRHHAMPVLADAFGMVHQPDDHDQALAARRRLAFNELLLLQLGIALKRHYTRTMLVSPVLKWNKAIDEHIRARFPFVLTQAQTRVITEIAQDLQQTRPMNRLLQGDVGAGKTVVALYALLLAVADRKQGALVAPTEILAEQHFASISAMLEGSNVRLALLTASQAATRSAQRAALQKRIERGGVDIVVGTHALLTESARFKDLAVVVIDEQHRFGVVQRAVFRARGQDDTDESGKRRAPHHLVMTATPIPRTLSLTVFGDLDVSIIDELPPGRTPITTRVVGEDKADEVYRHMARRLSRGEQAYVVVPAIDASGHETTAHLKNIRAHARLLADKFCKDHRVAAIHGKLKRQTRESIMHRFRKGNIHVLVATTVIEVGVDVPNARMMIVEHAERFGLAQLHQLRGRIGRSSDGHASVCVFVAEPTTQEAARRLEAVAATNDGFKIAEADLEIRGMGDFFGTRQHGLPPLRVAHIPDDMDLLQLARRDANQIVAEDPTLADPARKLLRKVLLRQYGETLGLIDVG